MGPGNLRKLCFIILIPTLGLLLTGCDSTSEINSAAATTPPLPTSAPTPTETPIPTNTPEPTPTPVPEHILLAEGTNPNEIESFPEEIQQALSNLDGNGTDVDELVDQVLLESRRNYWEEVAETNPEMVREILRFMVVDHIYGNNIDIDALTSDQLQNEIRNMHEVPFFHFYIAGTRRLNEDSDTLIPVVLSHNEIREMAGQTRIPFWQIDGTDTQSGRSYGFNQNSPRYSNFGNHTRILFGREVGIPGSGIGTNWGDLAAIAILKDRDGNEHPLVVTAVKEYYNSSPVFYINSFVLDDGQPFHPSACLTPMVGHVPCPSNANNVLTLFAKAPATWGHQFQPITTNEYFHDVLTLYPSRFIFKYPSVHVTVNGKIDSARNVLSELGLETISAAAIRPVEGNSNYSVEVNTIKINVMVVIHIFNIQFHFIENAATVGV